MVTTAPASWNARATAAPIPARLAPITTTPAPVKSNVARKLIAPPSRSIPHHPRLRLKVALMSAPRAILR